MVVTNTETQSGNGSVFEPLMSSNSKSNSNSNSKQNGKITIIKAQTAQTSQTLQTLQTLPLNRGSVKLEHLPEVKFVNLSANELSNYASDEFQRTRALKHSMNALDESCNLLQTRENGGGRKRTRLISDDSSDTIESSSGSAEKKKPEIPDGGYGWVIVFASLVVSLIADGLSFSFGLIHSELLHYFNESPSKTAWISSLFFSVPLLMGPVWSNLVDRFGCRRMTIIGGVISAIGFGLSAFGTSIEMLLLTFGIISGLGLGIGYVTAVVSIAFWFDKKRSFATGIGASGTGIGTVIYAPLTQFLIDDYGWRGATLILAGTMLNACVCGALMRDPDWLIEENRLESRSQSETTFSNSSVCIAEDIKKLLDTGVTKEAVLDTLVTKNNTEANQQIGDSRDSCCFKRYRSELFLPTYLSSIELDSIGEVKSLSRRSLRAKDCVGVGVELSRENLFSVSSGAPAPTSYALTTEFGACIGSPDDSIIDDIATELSVHAANVCLASMESLTPTDKNSFDAPSAQHTSLATLCPSASEAGGLLAARKHSHERNNGSRYSLNENLLLMAQSPVLSISNLRLNGNRHKSVDMLSHEKRNQLSLLLGDAKRTQGTPMDTIVAIPEHHVEHSDQENHQLMRERLDSVTGLRRLSKAKKLNFRSNLRKTASIRNANFLKDVRLHRNSIHYRGAMLNTHRYRLRASSCPNIFRNSMTTIAKEAEDAWYVNLFEILKSMFDFSMFKEARFALFNLSTLFLFIWFIIPYLYLPEYMKQYNYESSASAKLISTIGVAQTIGMIGLGYLGDRSWMNVNICYSVCMLLCGISVGIMPLLMANYYGLMYTCILFGLTFASSFSFTPSILVSIVDLDDFTCAYGLVLLVQGIGMLVGPPLAGAIYEIMLKWDYAFYVAGIFIAFSGLLSYLIEFCEKRPLPGSDSDVSETRKVHVMH